MKIQWNERRFEAGLDRGVIYLGPGLEGYPWNGLVSATRQRTGGEVTPHYIDGFKFMNQIAMVEHAGSIEAFDFPDEAAGALLGSVQLGGLSLDNQVVEEFGFAYRSLLGDNVSGLRRGYKIHIVYRALAVPNDQTSKTLSETPEGELKSWSYTTRPPGNRTYMPTGHVTVDSTQSTSEQMWEVERVLYGTDTTEPRQPSLEELLTIFGSK